MAKYTTTDLRPWLGDAAENLTTDQLDCFTALINDYEHLRATDDPSYSSDHYDDDTNAAWVAALEIAEGSIDLAKIGRDYDTAKAVAKQASIMAVLAGTSEAEVSRLTRFSRPALRKALGK